MRIAYYGLSSPIFYDYKTKSTKADSDTYSSPNPILDSAFGTIILFDELWFFCESLCPQNLRGLPYVKYLDDIIDLSTLNEINTKSIWNSFGGEQQTYIRDDKMRSSFQIYWDVVRQVGVTWEAAPDTHTHGLKVGEKNYSGSSRNPDNIVFDLATVEFLKLKLGKDIQLITNSFTQNWLDGRDSFLAKSKLTELLIIENVPNHLSRMGPYHKCIEEVRENDYLRGYRKWISEQKLKNDLKELTEYKVEIENQLAKAQKEIFLKYLDPKSTYLSIGKTIAGTIAENLIPFVSTAYSIGEELHSRIEKNEIMWQGFIISTKQTITPK